MIFKIRSNYYMRNIYGRTYLSRKQKALAVECWKSERRLTRRVADEEKVGTENSRVPWIVSWFGAAATAPVRLSRLSNSSLG